MASSKVMTNSRNSDLSRRASPAPSSTIPSATPSHQPTMTFYNNHNNPNQTLLDAQITLIDTPMAADNAISYAAVVGGSSQGTVDDVWREIVAGERKDVKEEVGGGGGDDEMMTLEDFLNRTTSGVGDEEDGVKLEVPSGGGGGMFSFDAVTPGRFGQLGDQVEGAIVGYGGGEGVVRGRRGRGGGGAGFELMMDKAAEQRQRRMIKNRESAARSRERKQAYQNELESLAARLEEENEELKKEKAEKTRKRLKQLKQKIVLIEEKRGPAKPLRRTHSWNCSMLV